MDRSKKPTSTNRRIALSGIAGGIIGSQIPSTWVRPVIESVVLPAHAEMSKYARWVFYITFTKVCKYCGWDGVYPEEMQNENAIGPPYIKIRVKFDVSEEEIKGKQFLKELDADGSGGAADFYWYDFQVISANSTSMEGTVTEENVDTPHIYSGSFQASKL